ARRVSALFAILVLSASPVLAQQAGVISGKITEKGGKEPVPYANVILLGTRLGAQTGDDGSFTIRNVPTGSYQVKVMALGYDPVQHPVAVNAGQITNVNVDLGGGQKIVKQIEEVTVIAVKTIDAKSSSTRHEISRESLRDLPVENIRDLLKTKPGIVATAD